MRKYAYLLLCLIMMLSFAGCGSETAKESENAGAVNNEITDSESENAEPRNTETANSDTNNVGTGDSNIEIDLTALSSTMVYAEVYNMTTSPDDYRGKSVKMSGAVMTFHDEDKDKYYFACVIADATACCSQGIEFELTEKYKYPDDYPEEGEDICVVGIFDTYEEDGYTYCVLKNAELA